MFEHELQLLLCCAQPELSSAGQQQIDTLLNQPLRWPYILQVGGDHGLLPLLHYHLNQRLEVALPEAIQQRLEDYFHKALQRNLFLAGQTVQLVKDCEQEGITAVPFKGPILAETFYNNLALRQFVDIDLLIHPDQAERVKQLLLAQGFEQHYHVDNAHRFVKQDNLIIFEIHWQAIGFGSVWLRRFQSKELPFTLDALQPRLTTTNLVGSQVPTLGLEDTLLLLCVHGSKHRWTRLNWLGDIATLLQQQADLDWTWLFHHSERWGLERMLLLGLTLAQRLLQTPLPEEANQRIMEAGPVQKLAAQIEQWLFQEPTFIDKLLWQPHFYRQLWARPADRLPLYFDHIIAYGLTALRPIRIYFGHNQLEEES